MNSYNVTGNILFNIFFGIYLKTQTQNLVGVVLLIIIIIRRRTTIRRSGIEDGWITFSEKLRFKMLFKLE